MNAQATALFYALETDPRDLMLRVVGLQSYWSGDVMTFESAGETVERQLALPFQAGMDAIEVSQARLEFRGRGLSVDATGAGRALSGDQGFLVQLDAPSRLTRVRLADLEFPGATVDLPNWRFGPAQTLRLVVRAAGDGAGGQPFGPPIFVVPTLPAPGALYASPLTGMSALVAGSNAVTLTLPGTPGRSWVIQFALGDEPTAIAPIAVRGRVTEVATDALPQDLSLTLKSGADRPLLWSHPGALLPESGNQEVAFLPLAKKTLTTQLESSSASAITLPITLEFTSGGPGALELRATELNAEYLARAIPPETETRLEGGEAAVTFDHPTGRMPTAVRASLNVEHLGTAHNTSTGFGTARPGRASTSIGWTVKGDRRLGTRVVPVARAEGGCPIARARLEVEAIGDVELALELRRSVVGVPGALVSAQLESRPLVRRLAAGHRGACWFDFDPIELEPDVPVWVVVRVTRGELRWFAPESSEFEGSERDAPLGVVTTGEEPWQTLTTPLAAATAPFVQLSHRVATPVAPPVVSLERDGAPLIGNLLAHAERLAPTEFAGRVTALSPALVELVSTPDPETRRVTDLQVASRDDVSIHWSSFELVYDPYGAGRG